MSSLMHLTPYADRLVLSYPLWLGMTLLLAAAALLACAVLGDKRIRRRWTLSAATVVAAWAGLYFSTFSAIIAHESGSVCALFRCQQSVDWKDAADIYLERSRGDRDWRIVVIDRQHRSFDFNVADLSIDDRDRVMAYMVDRMPDSAFPRSPALLKRQAPSGPRPVGLFSDQQT